MLLSSLLYYYSLKHMPQIPQGTFSLYNYGVAHQIKVSEDYTLKINGGTVMEVGPRASRVQLSSVILLNQRWTYPCSTVLATSLSFLQPSKTCALSSADRYTESDLDLILDEVLLSYTGSVSIRASIFLDVSKQWESHLQHHNYSSKWRVI